MHKELFSSCFKECILYHKDMSGMFPGVSLGGYHYDRIKPHALAVENGRKI